MNADGKPDKPATPNVAQPDNADTTANTNNASEPEYSPSTRPAYATPSGATTPANAANAASWLTTIHDHVVSWWRKVSTPTTRHTGEDSASHATTGTPHEHSPADGTKPGDLGSWGVEDYRRLLAADPAVAELAALRADRINNQRITEALSADLSALQQQGRQPHPATPQRPATVQPPRTHDERGTWALGAGLCRHPVILNGRLTEAWVDSDGCNIALDIHRYASMQTWITMGRRPSCRHFKDTTRK